MAGSEIFHKLTLGDCIVDYLRNNSEFRDKIKQGIADIKARRIRPWEEIRRELEERRHINDRE